jgi:hypothetical protein
VTFVLPEVTAVMWGAVLWQVVALRRRDSPTRRGVLRVLIALSCAFSLILPQVIKPLDHAGPGANFGRLLADSAGMFLAYAVQALMLQVASGEKAASAIRRRRYLLLVVLVAMAVEFLRAPMPVEAYDYVEVYGQVPLVAVYVWTFEGYFLLALLDIGRLTLTATRHAARRSSRVGMRMLTAAVAFALVYVVNGIIDTWLRLNAKTVPGFSPGLVNVCLQTSGILLVAGLTIPAWGPAAGRMLRIPARRRTLRNLERLWARVTEPFPETVLEPAPGQASGQDFQLASKTVEIQDAMRRLEPYFEAEARTRAEHLADVEGLTGTDADAAVAAAAIEAACAAARSRRMAQTPATRPVPDHSATLGPAIWFSQVGKSLGILDTADEQPKVAA